MKLTPAMQQYHTIKEAYPDALVLFRMGDFYETFFDDAVVVSRILNITLTNRGQGDPNAHLAGFPYHALDKYVGKLVKAGYKVALCDQLEDPKKAKGVVKRGVTRVITPGTVIEDHMLECNQHNYLGALYKHGDAYGLAISDVSTGLLIVGEFTGYEQVVDELTRFGLAELIRPESLRDDWLKRYYKHNGVFEAVVANNSFSQYTCELLDNAIFLQRKLAQKAAVGLLRYLDDQGSLAKSLRSVSVFKPDAFMSMDQSCVRNLELLRNNRDGSSSYTLVDTIDKTVTPMGGRLLRDWLVRPLMDVHAIIQRHSCVGVLVDNSLLLDQVGEYLGYIKDIERISSRISVGVASPRDLRALYVSLEQLPLIVECIAPYDVLHHLIAKIPDVSAIRSLIGSGIVDEPPHGIREGGFIRDGYHQELDELRGLHKDAHGVLAKIERRYSEQTGIPSLKIRYNRTFGYFIEVSNRYKDSVPAEYIRKQTLTSGERYITEELKEYEHKILGAQERIRSLEYDLFQDILQRLLVYVDMLYEVSRSIATLDVLYGFSVVSKHNRYCKPEMITDDRFAISELRHPVIELLEPSFVANDCVMDESSRFMIITGPNMAGKSTYMRQVALCVILAQIGCFVPASRAIMGVVDRIFTRVGAHDDLSGGQSTFMVEMAETANIIHHATSRSLVILDEIGRGTSTYDGTAIAWAVAEDLIHRIKAKTLFATHFHVLTVLGTHSGVVNMHVAVDEHDDTITFLHRIKKGSTDKSYGIHVARIAGIPQHVLDKAQSIQLQLENEDSLKQRVSVDTVRESPRLVRLVTHDQYRLSDYS